MKILFKILPLFLLMIATNLFSQDEDFASPSPPPPSYQKIKRVTLNNHIKFNNISDNMTEYYEEKLKKELNRIFNNESIKVEFYLTDYPFMDFSSESDEEKEPVKTSIQKQIEEMLLKNTDKVLVYLHYKDYKYVDKVCQISIGKNIAKDIKNQLEKANICQKIKSVRMR